jgi:hypothetical protein
MTYEEIQKYPVGTIYKYKLTMHNIDGFWYNDGDRIILATDDTLTNLHFYDDNTYTATRMQRTDYTIDGWLLMEKNGIVLNILLMMNTKKLKKKH